MTTQNVERNDRSHGYCCTCRIAGHIHPADSPLAGCMTEDNGVRHSEKDGHVIRPWSLEDITKQDGGRRKLVPQRIVELLLSPDSPLDIMTFKDNGDIVVYDRAKNTGIWQLDGEQAIKETVTDIVDASCDSDIKEQLTSYIMKEIIFSIQCHTYMDRGDFASPPMKIPMLNGVYNFTLDRLEPNNQENHFLYQVPIKYDANASCPKIDAFILEALDEERKDLIYEITGYILCANAEVVPNRWQRAFNCYGSGDNSKSATLKLMIKMGGEANVSSQPLQAISEDRFAAASLEYKLANIAPEIGERRLINPWQFKALTGGDPIEAQQKFKQSHVFRNRAILVFSCNTLPQTGDDTDAYHKRWITIPFNNKISHDKQDPEIVEKIATPEELSGFFNKSIAAYRKMCARKTFTNEGETVEAKREQYNNLADPIKRFVDAHISDDPDGWVNKQELYAFYLEYTKTHGIWQHPTINTFLKAILDKTNAYRGRARDSYGANRQVLKGIKLETEELPTVPTVPPLPTLPNFISLPDPITLKLEAPGKPGTFGTKPSPVGDSTPSQAPPDPSKVTQKCAEPDPGRIQQTWSQNHMKMNPSNGTFEAGPSSPPTPGVPLQSFEA